MTLFYARVLFTTAMTVLFGGGGAYVFVFFFVRERDVYLRRLEEIIKHRHTPGGWVRDHQTYPPLLFSNAKRSKGKHVKRIVVSNAVIVNPLRLVWPRINVVIGEYRINHSAGVTVDTLYIVHHCWIIKHGSRRFNKCPKQQLLCDGHDGYDAHEI